jgi:hypothetical protein
MDSGLIVTREDAVLCDSWRLGRAVYTSRFERGQTLVSLEGSNPPLRHFFHRGVTDGEGYPIPSTEAAQ